MTRHGVAVPDGPDVPQMIRRAATLTSLGRREEAVPLLTDVLRLAPDNAQALAEMARALYTLDPPRSLEFADRTVAVSPQWEYAHRLRSIVLSSLGRKADALEAARTAVSLDAESVFGQTQLFDCLRDCGQRAQAREAARRLLQMAPNDEAAHMAVGLVALDAGLNAEAEDSFRRAAAIDPLSSKALNNVGVALERQGRHRDAVEMFYRAAQLDPSKTLARSNAARAGRRYLRAGGVGIAIGVVLIVAASIAADAYHLGDDAAIILIWSAILLAVAAAFVIRRQRAKHFEGEVGRYVRGLTRRR